MQNKLLLNFVRPLLFVHSPPECCGNSKSFKTLNGFYFLIFVAVARKHLFLSGKQILVNGNEKLLPERMDWDTSKNVKKKLKFTRHYGSQRLSRTDLRVNEPRKSQDLLSFRRKVPRSLDGIDSINGKIALVSLHSLSMTLLERFGQNQANRQVQYRRPLKLICVVDSFLSPSPFLGRAFQRRRATQHIDRQFQHNHRKSVN